MMYVGLPYIKHCGVISRENLRQRRCDATLVGAGDLY